MNKEFSFRHLALAVLLVFAAVPVSAQLAIPTPNQSPNQALDKVEMVLDWKALPTYAGFYLARELGAFERRGIDISFTEVQGATPAAELVGRGDKIWIGSSSGTATA